MKTIRLGALAALSLSAAFGLAVQACDETIEPTKSAATADAAADSTVADTGTPTSDGAAGDGSPTGDAGSDAPASVVQFTVPASGGNVSISAGGVALTMTFPASAAGKNITLTPASAADVGWTGAPFLGAVKLEPAGERFSTPIVIKPANKAAIGAMLAFPDSTAKGPASPLPVNTAGDGFELTHFTALVLLPPDKVCDSQGTTDSPCSGRCGNFALNDAGACVFPDGGAATGATTFRQMACKAYSYCLIATGACCVDPSVDAGSACSLENQKYGIVYTPSGNNGAINYCEGTSVTKYDAGGQNYQCGRSYSFSGNNGCLMLGDCGGAGANGVFRLDCNGTTCACSLQGSDAGAPFAQGGTCDTTATMRKTYFETCGHP